MTRALAFTLALLLSLTVSSALAQGRVLTEDRFSIELDADAAFATQDLGTAELGAGFGFEVDLSYRLTPHLWAYAGWGWHHFEADGLLVGMDTDAEETGYTFGLRFAHPLGTSPLGYYVQAGGIYDHIEFEDADSDLAMDTEHGLGWELGVGLVAPLTSKWRLTPGVQYRSLSRDLDIGNVSTDLDLRYVTIRVGFSRTF